MVSQGDLWDAFDGLLVAVGDLFGHLGTNLASLWQPWELWSVSGVLFLHNVAPLYKFG